MVTNIDILVGCQYGSEGKGLVAAMIAERYIYDWIISVNSAQAGHTIYYNGVKVVNRQLPSGALINHNAQILLGAGSVINPAVLKEEIMFVESLGVPIWKRLHIHEKAIVIEPSYIEEEEQKLKLFDKIGSTCEGVGVANSKRALRSARTFDEYISNNLADRQQYNLMNDDMSLSGEVLIEGSQGHALSIFSEHYPQCTSRDTTASAFLSYARLSPRRVRNIYGVFRTFPIRVAGNSGYLYGEIDWPEVARISGYGNLEEKTTVTKRVRRVGMWDAKLARQAARINGINRPILTFANYLHCMVENAQDRDMWPSFVNNKVDEMAVDVGRDWFAISTSKEGGWWFNKKHI